MISDLWRHRKRAAIFLCFYFGFQIFGDSAWPFVVASVQNWWHRGGVAYILAGFLCMAVFVGFSEYRRRKEAVGVSRAGGVRYQQRRQPEDSTAS